MYQSGKAILTVECDGDDAAVSVWSLYASIQPLSGVSVLDYGHTWLQDAVTELAALNHWLPAQCYRMKHGDKLVFKVTFRQTYTVGDRYSSDDDESLEFISVRKLRHVRGSNETRRMAKRFYRAKKNLVYGGIYREGVCDALG